MSRRIAIVPDDSARTVLVSVNPKAGRRSRHARVSEICRAILAAGYQVDVLTELSELQSMAAERARTGELRAVIAIGGDGTASVVRNHVPLEIPILPVPLGTENLLGRYVGQGVRPSNVVATLEQGVVVALDLGRAGGKYFLLMISIGFDAEVIRRLHEERRGNITRMSYIKPTLATVRSYTYPVLRLYCDDAMSVDGSPRNCRWLFGFNLPLYACGWQLTPDATSTDGLLDICAFERGSLAGVLRYLWHVTLRGHDLLDDTFKIRVPSFRVEAPNSEPVPYQLDGDFGGMLPIEVEIVPGALRLLVTRPAAARLGFGESGESRLHASNAPI